jgi:hypothetical protein
VVIDKNKGFAKTRGEEVEEWLLERREKAA